MRPAVALHVEGDPRLDWTQAFAAAFPDWDVLWSDEIAGRADDVALAVVWLRRVRALGR